MITNRPGGSGPSRPTLRPPRAKGRPPYFSKAAEARLSYSLYADSSFTLTSAIQYPASALPFGVVYINSAAAIAAPTNTAVTINAAKGRRRHPATAADSCTPPPSSAETQRVKFSKKSLAVLLATP